MKRIVICLVFAALTLGALPVRAQSAPTFAPVACPMPIPAGTRVTCGEIQVPENRSQPNGRMIWSGCGWQRQHARWLPLPRS